MPRFTSLIIAASLAAAAGACAPVVATQGFQAVDAKPQDIQSGVDTRETVLTKLGTPSTTSTFESENVWYYLTQTTQRYTYNKPQVSQRTVTEITFSEADGKVASVRNLGLEDGRQIAMERRETPTRGRQLTILEQLLGNVGRGQLPRTEDDVPGQRRPD
ncbi:outer membrane protein assembly factor BamE [Brevundimonas sp. 3P9-tot-E]|jgi:outer membrane protein assembly factor BamE (lipoprotein component of BamABCDE complex)|uniref:outer membrane protein assembly factor BamE domain-containing protein n=1 Tax=Brevundimonas TaxID=41275 RepID=UPI000F78EE93|nr:MULTISPECIES: outer membrane protein assembly factor BamE [Brevundimonas]MDA0744114.1 outer membrane protein assembly factor BamE [Pseudomonadota bacterium]MBK1970507.1 outer membrane protein assembly factor BamE [Brevundimonas diminuta]MBK1975433.1 outer membrane protein assembly factor BamE [Brevundimonas diminuta]MDA1321837.1 outer membrane protein assembly factor BamE [Pseudomonadota bacterium]MDM8352931.1 outer membrane protein assembly factor BamE [Brevundimonas diminuta]